MCMPDLNVVMIASNSQYIFHALDWIERKMFYSFC